MIHYILLPTEERRALRREYRLRLAILAFFFISCAVAVGIIALLPAYNQSSSLEKDALAREVLFQKDRKASGAEDFESELLKSQAVADKIASVSRSFSATDSIQKIVAHRKKDLFITSFTITTQESTTTVAQILIQGRSGTRESLLDFKKQLENDPRFGEVDLPLSDLAKSKNIAFSMKLKVKP